MMVFWQALTNLREYVANKPPGVTFFFCLLALALSFICLGVYSYTHTLPNPDVVKDWNHLLASIAQYNLCVKNNNTSFTTIIPKLPNKEQKTLKESLLYSTTMENSVVLHVRVPLMLAPKSQNFSQSIFLHTSFSSRQLQLEGNEIYIVTIDFTANDSNSCLTIRAPSHLLPVSPVPPTCPQTANNKEPVYTEARKLMAPALKCYSLQSIYDPTLQVMLTKEEQLVAVRHLVEVAVVLLGVCLILCLSVSITHSSSQRHRWTEQDLHQEPLIDN